MFTKLNGVPEDRLDEVIDAFTEADWEAIEEGYLRVAIAELSDWWRSMLGLAEDVDVALLFCNLYTRSITRTPGA